MLLTRTPTAPNLGQHQAMSLQTITCCHCKNVKRGYVTKLNEQKVEYSSVNVGLLVCSIIYFNSCHSTQVRLVYKFVSWQVAQVMSECIEIVFFDHVLAAME